MAATRGAKRLIELVNHCKTNVMKLTLTHKEAIINWKKTTKN